MKRIKELFYKLASVKGLFAIASTVIFSLSPSGDTLAGFVIAWLIFILGREAFKWLSILKK